MIDLGEIGYFLLILSFICALCQTLLPLLAFSSPFKHNKTWQFVAKLSSRFAFVQLLALTLSFLSLIWLFVISDFSYKIVFSHSHSLQPLLYKIAGTWGNHEGSMLLWVLVLSICGWVFGIFSEVQDTLKNITLAIQGFIGSCFLLFIILTSNPFTLLLPAAVEGNSLNPILQDPGLVFHPPMLYIGYVGLSIVFSMAIATLIEGKFHYDWARWIRRWVLFAWAFLTAGIALGSWWAYYELGWGGFWFWDPVENASFMPWLATTALLHSVIVSQKRGVLREWTLFLAILAFSFSLLGTFIVRSGLLTSVHSFANDPLRGVFILALIFVLAGGGFLLFAVRMNKLKSSATFAPISKEGALLVNNLLLSVSLLTVLVGTVYPLILESVTGERISVGPPFFNITFIPLFSCLLVLVGIGPMLAWRRADWFQAFLKLRIAIIFSLCGVLILLITFYERAPFSAFGMGLGIWIALSSITNLWFRIYNKQSKMRQNFLRILKLRPAIFGMFLAHFGVAIVTIGVTGTSLLTIDANVHMHIGDHIKFNNAIVRLRNIEHTNGANYQTSFVHLVYEYQDGRTVLLSPEKRLYISGHQTTEAAIHSNFWYDLYATTGNVSTDVDDKVLVSLLYKPLAPWLWLGGFMMVLGAIFALFDSNTPNTRVPNLLKEKP